VIFKTNKTQLPVNQIDFFNIIIFDRGIIDAPPNSLMDSTASPKVKTMEGVGVGVRSLVHNTSGVEGRAGIMG